MAEKLNSAQYDYSLLKQVGEDVFISANAEIRRPQLASLGSHIAIDSGFYCTTQLDMGDYIHLGPYITVIGGAGSRLEVGHFATIAAGTRIIAGSDSFLGEGFTSVTVPEPYRDTVTLSTIRVGRFAGIGTNVVLMPGVHIAEGSVVGANSLVTKDTEPWTIYVGSPARPVKMRPSEKMLAYAAKLGYE